MGAGEQVKTVLHRADELSVVTEVIDPVTNPEFLPIGLRHDPGMEYGNARGEMRP